MGLRKIPGNNRHCVVLSSDIKEAFFVAQTLSSQHVCNRGGFFCLQIPSPSRIMRAKAVIPAHYFVNGLTTDVSGLEPADEWVNEQEKGHHAEVRRLDSAGLTLNAAELKGSGHRVYYFGNHFEKK